MSKRGLLNFYQAGNWAQVVPFCHFITPIMVGQGRRTAGAKAAAADKAAKAQKVMVAKRTLPHCSASAFTAMVKLARTADMSEFPSRRTALREARSETLGHTPYGPMITTVTLLATPPYANRTMYVANPLAYLHRAFEAGGGFFELMKAQHEKRPSSLESPWSVCLYSDEVVPGNQLATHHSRKMWMIYFSFLELHQHLSNERAWAPIVAEQSDKLKTVQAGISQVFRRVIKLLFGDDFDLRAGIQLTGPDGTTVIRLFAVLSVSARRWCSQVNLGLQGRQWHQVLHVMCKSCSGIQRFGR